MKSHDHEVLIEVKNLKKHFHMGPGRLLKAVDNVSFNIYKGETLGLVGESGCGKTTCGRTILGIYGATDGEVFFEGESVHKLTKKEKVAFQKQCQIIFQDPYASLNPRMTVGDIIAEGLDIHEGLSSEQRIARVHELLKQVGLNKEHINRFPHEFSGGQRQRIGIARALAINPKFIVCDEPISALDVSIQAQIVNLLVKLQKELGLTYLFIAHDLSMVKHISDRVGVMYLGHLIELSDSDTLYDQPKHPYTQALLSAIPVPNPRTEKYKERIKLEGEVPSPVNPAPGCRFKQRCKHAQPICGQEVPLLKKVAPKHFVACHLY